MVNARGVLGAASLIDFAAKGKRGKLRIPRCCDSRWIPHR